MRVFRLSCGWITVGARAAVCGWRSRGLSRRHGGTENGPRRNGKGAQKRCLAHATHQRGSCLACARHRSLFSLFLSPPCLRERMRRRQPQRTVFESPPAGEGTRRRALLQADRGWHGPSSPGLSRLSERDPNSNGFRQRVGSPTQLPEAPQKNETPRCAGSRSADGRTRTADLRVMNPTL